MAVSVLMLRLCGVATINHTVMASNTDPPALKLWCRIDGYKLDTLFSLQILQDADVHDLRNSIIKSLGSWNVPDVGISWSYGR